MPNYCSNRLTVIGDAETLDKFVELAREGKELLDFDKIHPAPEEWRGSIEWQRENWGTKWNCAPGARLDDVGRGQVVYCFDTAWSPPIGVIKVAARRFDKLAFKLEFAELGNDFSGLLVALGDWHTLEEHDRARATAYGEQIYGWIEEAENWNKDRAEERDDSD